VAAPPPLLGKVQTLISDLKAGSSYSGYEPDQFAADVKAGKVNTTLLADTFDFSDEYKKHAMKTYQEMVAAKMENAKPVKEIDWSEFEGILDADLLADVKSTVATMQEEVLKKEHPIFKEFDQMAADFKVGVDGPGGLMEMARKREAAGSAGIEGIITELETLEKDIAGLKTMTIAEILENEPELRKEVEAELSEHNWAP